MKKAFSSFQNCLILVMVVIGSDAFAQAGDVTNKGMVIRIRKDAIFYIGGSYTDAGGFTNGGDLVADGGGNVQLDAPIYLSGTLRVDKDINNNATTGLIFNFEDVNAVGTVVLGGVGAQKITGNADIYFPNLTLNKAGSSNVKIERNLTLNNNLAMTSGTLDLNSHNINLGLKGQILQETETNRIFGDGEIVSSPFSTIVGDVPSYNGIGLGYNATASQNFSNVVFKRVTGGKSTFTTVADGIVGIRWYRMKTSTTTVPPIPQPQLSKIYFSYHDTEIPAEIGENNIAIYASKDNGATWLNVTSGINRTTNVITGSDIDTNGDNNFSNIYVLTVDTCSAAHTEPVVLHNYGDGTLLASNHYINICEGDSLAVRIAPNSPYYAWTKPDGTKISSDSTYTIDNITRTPEFDGFHKVLTRTPRGCEGRNKFTVNVRSIPVPGIQVTPDPSLPPAICFRTPLQFLDISTTADTTAITSWAWNLDNGWDHSKTTDDSLRSDKTFSYVYDSAGTKTPTLVATSTHGCVSPMTSRNVTIETLPNPTFYTSNNIVSDSIRFICEDKDVLFNNASAYSDYTHAPGAMDYLWTFDDGQTSTAKDPVHIYDTYNAADTIRTVKLLVTAHSTGCHDEVTQDITVNPEPIPMFDPTIDAITITEACAGIYIDFQNQTTMPGPYPGVSYVWDFDNSTNSTQPSPSWQFGQEKPVYNVKLTAISDKYGCNEFIVKPVIIRPVPEGLFSVSDMDICLDEDAVFTNGSTIQSGTMTYMWDFNDTNTSTSAAAMVTHSYADPRQYKVTLTRTSDYGCTNEVSRTLRVHPSPVADFQFVNACDQHAVQFYNSSVIQMDAIAQYLWTFGDGTTSIVSDPAHIFPTYGTYNTTLTVTSNYGCADEITFAPAVYRNPGFNLGAVIASCTDNYLIDPASDGSAYLPAGSSYSWADANGVVIANTQTLSVSTSGVYSLTVQTASPESCQTKINLPLFLFTPVDLGNDVSACAQVILDAEANLPGEKARAQQTQYQWKKDGTNVSTNQVLTVTQPGDYEITITRIVAGTSCSSTDVIHVDIALPLSLTLPPNITECAGGTVTLDAGVAADSYKWVDVNTGAIIGIGQTVSVSSSSVYRVDVFSGSCQASSATEVVFSTAPNVSFTLSTPQVCSGQDVTFTDISFSDNDTIVSTDWDLGEGTHLSDQASITTSYSPGTYTVTLSATTSGGCSFMYSNVIDVKSIPVPDVAIPGLCQDTDLNITNNTAASVFHWDFGDGTGSDDAVPAKAFDTPGLKQVTFNATDNGCTAQLVIPVQVYARPDLQFGNEVATCGSSIVLDAANTGSVFRWYDPANPAMTLATTQQYPVSTDQQIGVEIADGNGCTLTQETSVKLNSAIAPSLGSDRPECDEATLYPGYFPNATFAWTTGDTTPSIDIDQSGNYGVTITDQNGCTGSTSVNITINETPVISNWADSYNACQGQALTLSPAASVSTGYLWSNGETSSSIQVSSAGSYTVTVSNQTCVVVRTTTVSMNDVPVAAFSVSAVCAGDAVNFQNTTTYGGTGNVTYLWEFGDGSFSASADPSKIYSGPSAFLATLKAESENGCSSEVTHSVDVKHTPVALFDVSPACSGNLAAFTNTSTYAGASAVTYHWNSGAGDTYDGVNPPFLYPIAGSYTATLQASTGDGCSDTYLQQVDIGASPDITGWSPVISSCNNSVLLDASNAGSTYLWSDNSTQQTLVVTASGSYEVLITSADNCSITATSDVTINSPPQPLLDDVVTGCGSVILDPQADAATYSWTPTGDQTRTITVTQSGTYAVQLISQQLCIANDVANVTVYEVPTFDLGPARFACEGDVVSLTPVVAIPVTYEWSTSESSPSIDVTTTNLYSVTVTSQDNCTYDDNITVTFNVVPVIDIDDDVAACGDVTLDAGNPGATYEWSTGSTARTLTTDISGTYGLTVRNNVSCSASKNINVTVLELPAFDLGSDKVVCDGETVTIDGGEVVTTFDSFTWSDDSAGRYLTVGSSGSYSATAKGTNGCESTDNILVTVRTSLGLELGTDRLLCSSGGATLSANVDNVSYAWGSDTGATSTAKDIIVEKAGIYWLSIVDGFGCTMSDSVSVSPTTEALDASFLVSSVIGQGDIVQFAQLNEDDSLSYAWDFGDGATSTTKNPEHRYFFSGDYEVTLTVSNGTCSDTLEKTITVRIARFDTKPDPVLPQFIDIVEASVSPNPSPGNVTVKLSLTTETDVVLEIYSLQGVQQLQYAENLKERDISFDLSKLAQGPYLIKVAAGSKIKVLKLIKSN